MKSNSKMTGILGMLLLTVGLIWQGCQSQQPTAAGLAAGVDRFSLFNFTAANVGMVTNLAPNVSSRVNTNLYVESNEPALTTPHALAKASSYADTPVTVLSGPLPYQIMNTPAFNPEGHVFSTNAYGTSVWPAAYIDNVVATGFTDPSLAYGIQITGLINDPENSAYPPGPGNIDPIAFEYYPYFDGTAAYAGYNGNLGQYDLSPFQGFEFYVYLDPSDSAVERILLVNTFQTQPLGSPPGGCNNPSYPFLSHCYDSFEYDYTNSPKGQWVLVQKRWGDFRQFGFGSPTTPPTLTGANLQQFEFFQWVESNAAQAGPVTVNFTLAGMKFF